MKKTKVVRRRKPDPGCTTTPAMSPPANAIVVSHAGMLGPSGYLGLNSDAAAYLKATQAGAATSLYDTAGVDVDLDVDLDGAGDDDGFDVNGASALSGPVQKKALRCWETAVTADFESSDNDSVGPLTRAALPKPAPARKGFRRVTAVKAMLRADGDTDNGGEHRDADDYEPRCVITAPGATTTTPPTPSLL